MRRIALNTAFRARLAAGMAPEQAVLVLRRLRLYWGGIEIDQNDVRIDYDPKTNRLRATPAITLRGPVRLPGGPDGPLEVDADQVEKVIAVLQPDPTKARRGSPPVYRWDEYIDPLIDIELERGGRNVVVFVRKTLERCKHCKGGWKGIRVPSVRQMQDRVLKRRNLREK